MKASRIAFVLALAFAAPPMRARCQQPAHDDSPETAMATFHVKQDNIDAFVQMMPAYWQALRDSGLVTAETHILLRGEEDGKPVVVEIFSWKNHDAADHVPAPIQSYWDRFNAMVEERNGHPAIEFPEVTVINRLPQDIGAK